MQTQFHRARQLRRDLTPAEQILWRRLRRDAFGVRFRRQHPIGPFIVDFAHRAGRLAIEVDGDSHFTDEAKAYDQRRTAFLRQQGWRVIRVTNVEVYQELDAVLERIWQAVHG